MSDLWTAANCILPSHVCNLSQIYATYPVLIDLEFFHTFCWSWLRLATLDYRYTMWCQWQTVDCSHLPGWVPGSVSFLAYCDNSSMRCSFSIHSVFSEICVILCKEATNVFSYEWRYVQPLELLGVFNDCIGQSYFEEQNSAVSNPVFSFSEYRSGETVSIPEFEEFLLNVVIWMFHYHYLVCISLAFLLESIHKILAYSEYSTINEMRYCFDFQLFYSNPPNHGLRIWWDIIYAARHLHISCWLKMLWSLDAL